MNGDAHGDLRWGGRGHSQSNERDDENQSCEFRHTNHGEVPLYFLRTETCQFELPSVGSKLGASS
jgi:hypothetical protein